MTLVNAWIIIAVDGDGEPWIMDSSEDLKSHGLLDQGIGALDNNIYVPSAFGISPPAGLYRLEEIKIAAGGAVLSGDEIEWEGDEISGVWLPLHIWSEDAIHTCAFHAQSLAQAIRNDPDASEAVKEVVDNLLSVLGKKTMKETLPLIEELTTLKLEDHDTPTIFKIWDATRISLNYAKAQAREFA